MNRQTALQAKETGPLRKNSASLLRHTAVRPIADHELPSNGSAAGFSHDLTQVPVRPLMQTAGRNTTRSCPISPQRCPFGGACHSCPPRVQAKLKIGQPGDKYEQEADRVAEQVMRMPEPQVQRATVLQNFCDHSGLRISLTDSPLRRQDPAPMIKPAHGVTQNGQIAFSAPPSSQLLGHELVHVAQQYLGRRTHMPVASRAMLETEASHLSSRLSIGENVHVHNAASPAAALYGTDPDKTYTSTVGMETNDKYIAAAYEFHAKWGYNPINVASIEEITNDLAKGSGTLDRIRIVSHASQLNLFLQFAKGSPSFVLEEELQATTQQAAEQAGVKITAEYADTASQKHFRDQIVSKYSALAGRLGISKAGITKPEVEQHFRWLLNRHRAKGVPGVSKADRALIMPAINRQLTAVRRVAETTQGIDKADVVKLEKNVDAVGFVWAAMTPTNQLQETFNRAIATHTAFASRNFGSNQAAMKKRFTDRSTIEIRGCALGQTPSYMKAVQEYFGGAQGKPAVHAPRMFQYYGTIGLFVIPNDNKQIKMRWEKWKDRADLKASFKKWAPIYAPTQKIPANPTWSDLATYLRAGHALPIKHGSRLFTIKNMSENQVIDWFTKNDQRLTKAADIKNQFTGVKLSDEATKRGLFEWLQDQYSDNPKTRVFPYDPTWSAQFGTVAGKP